MSFRKRIKRTAEALERAYGAQRQPLTREQHGKLADAYERDALLDERDDLFDRIEALSDDFYGTLSPADRSELNALRTEAGKLAMAGRATADGSVVLRGVNAQVEPAYERPSPEWRQHKASVDAQAQRRWEAQQQTKAQQRQADWRKERVRIQERQAEAKRNAILHGSPNEHLAYLVEPPLSPPAWFQHRDGEQRYYTLPATVQPNEDGSRTLTFDHDPITGKPLNAPPPQKSPEAQFAEAESR